MVRTIDVSRVCPLCRGSKEQNGNVCVMCNGHGMIDTHPQVSAQLAPERDDPASIADQIMRPQQPNTKIERKTIGAAWASYERTALDPIGASQVQRQEMRRAWYTGVAWLMDMLTFTLDDGEEATEDDLKYLDDIVEELKAFAEKMKRGNA